MASAAIGTDYALQVFTVETGAQALLPINWNKDVTYALRAGSTDVIDIQVILKENGTRTTAKAGLFGQDTDTLEGPVAGIAINIQTNLSNNIEFEVRTSSRMG